MALRLASLVLLSAFVLGCGDDVEATSGGSTSSGADGGSGPGAGSTGPGGTGGEGGGGGSVPEGGCGFPGQASWQGELDPYVDVPATGPYGTHQVSVPAASNWVMTGLFLREGESVTLSAEGSWSIDGQTFTGPEGRTELPMDRGCARGSLVARLGLHYADELHCVGPGTTWTVPRDGILYVGANFDTDLGETYGTRLPMAGALTVTVESTGDTVPTVPATEACEYDYTAIASGWVELRGRHTIITIPAADAEIDRETAAPSIDVIDQIYDTHAQIRPSVPYDAQRVRWFPDPQVSSFAYMLAGNPVRCDPSLMSGVPTQRILNAIDPPTDVWGFAHELGHSFTFSNGTWSYMILNLESWPNLFTLYTLDILGRTHPNVDSYCDGKDAYLANGAYPTLRDDPFLQLCFLMELTTQYDWDFWEAFFLAMDMTTGGDIPYDPNNDAVTWTFVRDRFNQAAGADTTPVFNTWKVPLL